MYDIYFDENDMHQLVEEEDIQEFWLMGESFVFSSTTIDLYPEDDQDTLDDLLIQNDDYIVVHRRPDEGYHCKKCDDVFPHAEPNQKDGTLICYSCRNFG